MTLYEHITETPLFKSFVVGALSLEASIQSCWEYLFHLLHSVSVKTFHHWAVHSHSSVITCTLSNLYPVQAYGRIIVPVHQEKDVGKTRSELGFGESVGRPTWGGRMALPMSINASFRPCHTERQDRLEPGCEELCGAENLQFSPVDSTRDVASRIWDDGIVIIMVS